MFATTRSIVLAALLCAFAPLAMAGGIELQLAPDGQSLVASLPPGTRAVRLHTAPVLEVVNGAAVIRPETIREIAYTVMESDPNAPQVSWPAVSIHQLPPDWAVWLEAENAEDEVTETAGLARILGDADQNSDTKSHRCDRCNHHCGCNGYWWETCYDNHCWHDCDCCGPTAGEVVAVVAIVVAAEVADAMLEDCSLKPASPGSGVVLLLGALSGLALFRRRRGLAA